MLDAAGDDWLDLARRYYSVPLLSGEHRCEEFSTFLYPSLLFYSYLLVRTAIYSLIYPNIFFITFYHHLPINLTQCFAAPARYHSTLITHH